MKRFLILALLAGCTADEPAHLVEPADRGEWDGSSDLDQLSGSEPVAHVALRRTCERVRDLLERDRRYGYDGVEHFEEWVNDCQALGVELRGEIPAQTIVSDESYERGDGYRVRTRVYRYQGPDYQEHVFLDARDGYPTVCTDRTFDHEDQTARCYQDTIESFGAQSDIDTIDSSIADIDD